MNIDLRFPGIFLILSIPVIIYFSLWYYKGSGLKKIRTGVMVFLRSLLLFQILLLLFDPVLTLSTDKTIRPKNIVLFDNSISIVRSDSTEADSIKQMIEYISRDDIFQSYLFGDSTRTLNGISEFDNTDNFTKVDKISDLKHFRHGSPDEQYENIIVITDGNFTDYSNNSLSNTLPINFIHTRSKPDLVDIFINDISYEDIIPQNSDISYEVIVGINGISSEDKFRLSVKENGKVVKNIIENVPENGSLKRIPVILNSNDQNFKSIEFSINKLNNEENLYNNSRKIFQKISNLAQNILIVYGNLSLDLKFILDIFSKHNFSYQLFDPADDPSVISDKNFDLILLYSYPDKRTYPKLDEMIGKFNSKLIFITEKTERSKLNELEGLSLNNFRPVYKKGFLSNNKNDLNSFLYMYDDEHITLNDLPSIEFDAGFIPGERPFIPILDILDNNSAHSSFRSIDTKKNTVLVNMRYFWNNFDVFDLDGVNSELEKFFLNVIEYLSIDKTSEQIKITPQKSVYSSGEIINFEGKIFDDNLRPLKNETVKLTIIENKAESEFSFKNDKYSANVNIMEPGLYTADISMIRDNKVFMFTKREFKIIENDQELSSLGANMDLMQDIADRSNGKLIPIFKAKDYFNSLIGKTKIVTENTKIKLVRNLYFFILMLLIFLVELGYRKYKDLL
ncbi:MAG: hypothetical protein JXR69_07275 [Candidatus Delongbacteria bacterium]|nr:hypothetical protein [Candidatus Delongbacteria bacterium]